MIRRGYDILSDIENYFETIKEEHPYAKLKNGIFYMNGDDGTDFDWDMNGRCCEFCMFYEDTDDVCIKVFIHNDDTMDGIFYNHNDDNEEKIDEEELDKGAARYLASLLLQEADDKNLFDKSISEINFDADVENMLPENAEIDMEEDEEDEYDDTDDLDDYEDDDY